MSDDFQSQSETGVKVRSPVAAEDSAVGDATPLRLDLPFVGRFRCLTSAGSAQSVPKCGSLDAQRAAAAGRQEPFLRFSAGRAAAPSYVFALKLSNCLACFRYQGEKVVYL